MKKYDPFNKIIELFKMDKNQNIKIIWPDTVKLAPWTNLEGVVFLGGSIIMVAWLFYCVYFHPEYIKV